MSEKITKSIIVKADQARVFSVLSTFSNYPKFIPGIENVQTGPGDMSHWKIRGPLGKTLEFDLETTRFDENQRIGWNTKDYEGDLTTSGQIVIADLPDQDTEITVTLNYEVGPLVSLLGKNPEEKVDRALRNFKAYIEGMPERIEL